MRAPPITSSSSGDPMNQRIDDIMLAAYVDGELNPHQLREIEQALAHDAEARLKVRRMREVSGLLRAACAESHFQDIPDRLVELVHRRPRRKIRSWAKWAIAAILLMAAYMGTAFLLETRRDSEANAATEDLQAMMEEIAEYHLVYARQGEHLAEIAADRRGEIEAWFGSLMNRRLRIPDLSAQNLTFAGARLLVLEGNPAAQLFYSRDQGEPIAVCVTFG